MDAPPRVLVGRPVLRTPDGEEELRPWDAGVGVYPDSDKLGVWPQNKLFRLADAVDYWEGEL